jgi:hypothetical protein
VLAQQLGVPAHHRRDVAQARQCGDLRAGERRRQVAEQPGAPEAAPTDDDTGTTGLLDHRERVVRLPDVAVAEHRDVDVLDQPGDGAPVGPAGVVLDRGAPVQGDCGTPCLLRDPAGLQVGEVVVVDALAGLHRDRDPVWLGRLDRTGEDLAQQPALPGQRCAAALAGHLRDRAAEVQVDVVDAVVTGEDLDRLADIDRGRCRTAAPSASSPTRRSSASRGWSYRLRRCRVR